MSKETVIALEFRGSVCVKSLNIFNQADLFSYAVFLRGLDLNV